MKQRMIIKVNVLIGMLLLAAGMTHAANRYWVAASASTWNNTANWSTSSGGSSGASVPGSGDVAIFDRNGVNNCTFDMDIKVLGIDVQSGYTGTITQSIYELTVSTSNASFADGSFAGGRANITIDGTFTISGTSFTSTSANLKLNGNFTYSGGSFAHNKGTVIVGAGITMTGSVTFYYLDFNLSSSSNITVASGTTLQVDGSLIYDGTAGITVNTGQIDVTGSIVINNTGSGGGGSATININGSGSQTFSGNAAANTGRLCNVTINKSGTLTLSNTISMAGNWTYNTGTVDASTNAATVAFCATATVDAQGSSSNMSFYDVSVNAGTCTIGGTFTAARNVSISGGATLSNGSNQIVVGGNWSNSGTFTNTSGTVTFNGTGTQTIIKSGAAETFYGLTINKASGSVQLNGPVTVTNALTLTSGKIETTSTNLLTLNNGATSTAGSDASFVSGPMKKIGNAAFTFPLGKASGGTNYYHPLGITAPSSSTDAFTTEYKPAAQLFGSSKDTTIEALDSCDHWIITRNSGTSQVKASVGWNSNCSVGTNLARLVLAGWDGTQWINLGNESAVASGVQGVLTASEANSFSSVSALLIATAKRSPFITLNTVALDSIINDGDTLYYTASGANTSGTYRAGFIQSLEYSAPLGTAKKTLSFSFFSGIAPTYTKIFCEVNAAGTVSNVRVLIPPDTLALDTIYYDIADSILALSSTGSSYNEQSLHPVKVLLDGGVTMSPDGDSSYDTFVVQGTSDIVSYTLTITDMYGNTIFTTTNPLVQWDGTDGSSQLVPPDTYNYEIQADGETLSGQFTLEY